MIYKYTQRGCAGQKTTNGKLNHSLSLENSRDMCCDMACLGATPLNRIGGAFVETTPRRIDLG